MAVKFIEIFEGKNQCAKFHFNGICSNSFVYHYGQNFLISFPIPFKPKLPCIFMIYIKTLKAKRQNRLLQNLFIFKGHCSAKTVTYYYKNIFI